jgi:uncharacterized protein YbjT (DUF2867 family)
MKKTVIVIGATGLIGRALVDQLLESNEIAQVITLTRRPLIISHEKFINHIVDFSKLNQYTEYFIGVDILFSCLGTTKKQAGSIELQRRVDLDYQYQAAQQANTAGIANYFLVSSSGASARSLSPYLKMKGELEDKVIQLGFDRCVIFRPSLLIGQREQSRAGEAFAGQLMPLLAYVPFLKRYRPIKGAEVAAKMAEVALIDNDDSTQNQRVKSYSLDQIF